MIKQQLSDISLKQDSLATSRSDLTAIEISLCRVSLFIWQCISAWILPRDGPAAPKFYPRIPFSVNCGVKNIVVVVFNSVLVGLSNTFNSYQQQVQRNFNLAIRFHLGSDAN